MQEQRNVTLGDVADFQNGYPFKPGELGHEGLPVVRIKQLLDSRATLDRSTIALPDRFHIQTGDLIFSWSGTLASVLWDRGDALLNQHLFRVDEREGVDRTWLHYVLDDAVGALMAKSHGTTMKHVTKRVLAAHRILLPPLHEQQRIAHVLSVVDANVAAVEAEAAATWSLHRSARSQVLSDAPEVPLSDVCAISARLVDPVDPQFTDLPHIGVDVIEKGTGRILNPRSARDDGVMSSKYHFREGDVIYSKIRPALRKVAVAPSEGLCSADAYPLTPTQGVPGTLLREVLLHEPVVDMIVGMSGRTKMPKVNRKELFSVLVRMPGVPERGHADRLLKSLRLNAESLDAEVETLKRTRAVMSSTLLRGEG